jgi:hypothetical protein
MFLSLMVDVLMIVLVGRTGSYCCWQVGFAWGSGGFLFFEMANFITICIP